MLKPNIEDAITRVRGLPTLPSVLRQILATTADPESSVIDLGRHIASDQSLSAGLLRLVNSAAYGYNRQIDSITTAIVILGFTEIRNLALAATAFRTFGGTKSGPDLTQLWRHSLATGMAAERLAKAIQINREKAFVSGLLHDIGKVVFNAIYPAHARRACAIASSEESSILDAENEVFGMNHAQVGAMLGEHWQLPPAVVEAIRYHHEGSDTATEPRLVSLTVVANWVTYQAGLGDSCNGKKPSPTADPGTIVSNEHKEEVIKNLTESSELIDEFLGVLF